MNLKKLVLAGFIKMAFLCSDSEWKKGLIFLRSIRDCEHQLVFCWKKGSFSGALENWMQIKATRFAPVRERNCRVGLITCALRHAWKWMGRARTIGAARARLLSKPPLPYSILSDKFAGSRKWRRRQHPITPARRDLFRAQNRPLRRATVISVNGAALSD